MTVGVDVLLLAGSLAFGSWVVRTVRKRGRKPPDMGAPGAASTDEAARDPLASFPLRLGDVVLRVVEGDEAWLAGALVFEEEQPVAALFVAPDAGADHALFVRPALAGEILWLDLLREGELSWGGDLPHAVEHQGARFERSCRLPVGVIRTGRGAPIIGERAIVAEYSAITGERLLLVAGTSARFAWRGLALAASDYSVLPGEKGPTDD